MLTILNVLLKSAVAWNVIDRCPARSGLRVLRGSAAFLDFDEYERLVEAARRDGHAAHLIALLGGEGGLRCGESWREWGDVDLTKRQLCVARSEW